MLVAVATRSDGAHAADAARRDGCRRGGRQLAAIRCAARLRRTARGVLRHARNVRASGAGADHRHSVDARGRAAPIAWRCRPASSIFAARRRRRTSARRRRCWPTWPRCTRCITGRAGCARSRERIHSLAASLDGALAALGYRQTNAAYFDTLRIEGADVRRSARRPRPPASISATRTTRIGISLDETTTVDDVKRCRRVSSRRAKAGTPTSCSRPMRRLR